jgi:tRNA threonylcarbamoyladenosine biosynthesis protein TsaB
MKILFIDSSTEILYVGLSNSSLSNPIESLKQEKTGLNHSLKIISFIQEIFQETKTTPKELKALSCSLGPGSFTGLRIGLCTVKGLSEGWKLPLVGLDTLKAMANAEYQIQPADFRDDFLYFPVIDARKGRFYTQGFSSISGKIEPATEKLDISAQELKNTYEQNPIILCGYQGSLLAQQLETLPFQWKLSKEVPWAQDLCQQGFNRFDEKNFLKPQDGPLYIRKSEAEENRILQGK